MRCRIKLMGLIAAGVTTVSGCGSTLYDPYTGELYGTYGVGVYGSTTYPYGTYSYPYAYSSPYAYSAPYAYGLPQPYSPYPYPPFGPTIPPW
jgi:hypothetical protein